MARDSFIFYRSFYEAISELPKENQADTYNAIIQYALNQEELELTGISKAIFSLVKPQLDANYKRYENGKQKKNKTEANRKQIESKAVTNVNVNVNANDNVNANVNDNVNVNDNASGLYDEDVEKINNTFVETLGSTNLNNIRECIGYLDELPFEVIEYALKKTARKGAKWDYAMTILNSYVEKKLNTLEKVQADEIEFKNKIHTENKEETEEEKMARKLKELEGD